MYQLKKFGTLLSRNHLTSNAKRNFSNSNILYQKINKILIANRGEIACRISRTAKKLGVQIVAVYSDVDRNSMHVDLADEAYYIGPAPSIESYLCQDKIISIAKISKCHAIHPGYGFLSENAKFAELCQKENIIFIGPPAKAIRDMGIKNTSKEIMAEAGVPIIEGYHGNDQSDAKLLLEAQKIGFPIMIKAVCGGGGKGMRISYSDNDFNDSLKSARTESQKAFGNSAVLLEKYIAQPRHIEVQVFADMYGNVIHLFERDCSVQRRHQKVIEEAPAPGISQELRLQLGATAVRAAKAVNYVGAGTVEFIMDKNTHNFHFMEMNTRLQVEHPVTEAITGLDLVEWQLKVAAGEPLPFTQKEVNMQGHAFEARIYAENPRNSFLPEAGHLLYLQPPKISDNIRVETGVRQNDEVSVYYDPMIAKLVIWGKNRSEALNILKTKLAEYNVAGLHTNIEFIRDLCKNPSFVKGQVHTGFIEENKNDLFPELHISSDVLAQAVLAILLQEEMNNLNSGLKTKDPFNPFTTETGLRFHHVLERLLNFKFGNEDIQIAVKYMEADVYLMRINNNGPWHRVTGFLKKDNDVLKLTTEFNGKIVKSNFILVGQEIHVFTNDREWKLKIPYPKFMTALRNEVKTNAFTALSPMPGVIDKLFCKQGDLVKKGDPLLVIVAMKMEHIVRASTDGVVDFISCQTGENVTKDKLLVQLKEPNEI